MRYEKEMMHCIYISGAITGTDDYEERFAKVQKQLEKNYTVINPVTGSLGLDAKLSVTDNRKPTWNEYMRYSLGEMLEWCNVIYMMKGWESSKGATIEHDLAKSLGYEIIYEEQDE